MDKEARLMRALGASAAPSRDPAFALAIIRAAEARRFRHETTLAVLRGGALTAAAAVLVVLLSGWISVNAAAVQNGVLSVMLIFALVGGTRLMTQGLATARVR